MSADPTSTRAVPVLTDETFAAAVLGNPRPVLVEFWAEWCPPCRQLAPILDALAADLAGQVDVVKVNIDENPQTVQRYGIMLAPTINLYRDGQVVRQVVGARSRSALLRAFGLDG
ncbi:MAG TPA: thioredoxin [Streptosporangiaceae bacterium]|nr:thioredoxin [Streptosporangiaceae bacterium]